MFRINRLASNMLATIVAYLVQFGITFFLTPYLIESLGNEAYAFIPLSNNIISYVNIITIALNSMASRFLSIEINQGNIERANEYFSSVFIANLILSGILLFPCILLVLNVEVVFDIPFSLVQDVKVTFFFAFAGMMLSLIFSVFSNSYYVKNRLELNAKRNIEGNLIRAICLILLMTIFQPHIYFITATMLVMNIYTCIMNIHYTKLLLPEIVLSKKEFRKKLIFQLLSSGIWNSVNQLSTVLLNGIDILLANILLGAEASGLYAVVKVVPDFIQSVVAMLVGVFVPQFTILYAKNQKQELVDNIQFSIKIMGLFVTLPVSFLMVFGKDFFEIWVPLQDSNQLYALSVLTIAPMIVTGSINTIFNVYTVTNKLKMPAINLLVTSIFNVLCVVVLIKYTNLKLYAIPMVALVIGLIRNLTFTPIYAARCLNLGWYTFYISIIRGSMCALVMGVFCCFYRFYLGEAQNFIELILAAIVCSLMALVVNFFIVFGANERKFFIEKIKRIKRG